MSWRREATEAMIGWVLGFVARSSSGGRESGAAAPRRSKGAFYTPAARNAKGFPKRYQEGSRTTQNVIFYIDIRFESLYDPRSWKFSNIEMKVRDMTKKTNKELTDLLSAAFQRTTCAPPMLHEGITAEHNPLLAFADRLQEILKNENLMVQTHVGQRRPSEEAPPYDLGTESQTQTTRPYTDISFEYIDKRSRHRKNTARFIVPGFCAEGLSISTSDQETVDLVNGLMSIPEIKSALIPDDAMPSIHFIALVAVLTHRNKGNEIIAAAKEVIQNFDIEIDTPNRSL